MGKSSKSDAIAHIRANIGKTNWKFGDYEILSQEPSVIGEADLVATTVSYLPSFLRIWSDIENATGHRWKCTSYIRNSPSHALGQAFDLAPDIADSATHLYAVHNNSDPVLYKRVRLIRALQTLRHNVYGPKPFGIFIEPDHLHVQVLAKGSGERFPLSVIQWKIAKPIYPDTFKRMALPIIH